VDSVTSQTPRPVPPVAGLGQTSSGSGEDTAAGAETDLGKIRSAPAPLVITVHGTPAPQGSKRHVGRGVMIETSKLVKPWREAVKHAALLQVTTEVVFRGQHRTIEGPVIVEVTFTLHKPASAPKRRTTWPQRKPDVDKLLRSTLDALSDAGVWVDDAQVVEVTARKVFPLEGVDALPHPGALIRIWEVTP